MYVWHGRCRSILLGLQTTLGGVVAWPVIVVLPALLADAWMLAWLRPLLSGAYAVGMQEILANSYLDSGWIGVSRGDAERLHS